MATAVHLTTVHEPTDSRILHRECASLIAAGYEVTIVACHGSAGTVDGVRICRVRGGGRRLARMTVGVWAVLRAALRARADIYHFHDPELIPAGLALRAAGKRVIYDVHEDSTTAILEREYLPAFLRPAVARALAALEAGAGRWFRVVLAERYYAERFPRGVLVLNYARVPQTAPATLQGRPVLGPQRLLYTGNVKVYRGALQHADLLRALPQAELFMVGRCSQELAAAVRDRAGAAAARLHLEGVGYTVPFGRITEYYLREQWTAALALFPPSPHTRRK